jgi:hypothetical protein
MNCRPLPPQSYCKYNPNNEMRWLGRGVETYNPPLELDDSVEKQYFYRRHVFRPGGLLPTCS